MSSVNDHSRPAETARAFRMIEFTPGVLGPDLTAGRSHGSERWTVLRRHLAAGDLGAAAVAGALAALAAGLSPGRVLAFSAFTAFSWFVTAFAMGLYAADDLRSWASGVAETPRLLVASLVASWPLFAAAGVLGAPRAWAAALVGGVAAPLLSGLARAAARARVHTYAPLQQRTVIVGSGSVAAQLVSKLETHGHFGLLPIGIVDDDVHDAAFIDLPVLGRLDDLTEIIRVHCVDRVIIAFSRANHEDLLRVVRACRDRSVAVDIVPRLFEFLDGARALDQVGGLPLMSIGAHKLSRSSKVAKRALDIAVSGLAMLVLSPLFLVVAFLIKLESRGPVFFRQIRAGRDGKVFKLVKFRSMYADAEEVKAAFQRENDLTDGVMFKIREDPRVTRVGRILRRYSLDELPQLINVLTGKMSLVGPRPLILPETAALAEPWQLRRLDLRPGITGPWQVAGRSDIPFQDMVRFDYQYVAGWSLARDVEILLETVPAVLSGRGAY